MDLPLESFVRFERECDNSANGMAVGNSLAADPTALGQPPAENLVFGFEVLHVAGQFSSVAVAISTACGPILWQVYPHSQVSLGTQ